MTNVWPQTSKGGVNTACGMFHANSNHSSAEIASMQIGADLLSDTGNDTIHKIISSLNNTYF